MGKQQSPPFLRRQLGKRWQTLRKQAGITFEEACRRLEISTGRMSRLENGETAPEPVLAKSLLDLYGVAVNDWEPVLEQVREARKKGWWQAYGVQARGYTALETAASFVRDYQLAYIPGLLQTEAYARTTYRAVSGDHSEQWIENDVTVRMIRQRRLVDDHEPLQLAAIVDESALNRPVGSAELVKAQLSHMMAMAELPNVTLQVVPFSAGPHIGMDGSFTLLSFDDARDGDVVYIENVAGSFQLEKDDHVRACRLAFERLRTEALSPPESAAVITRLADGL